MKDLTELVFEDQFVRSMPADPSTENVPRQVLNASYTFVDPTPVSAPQLLAWSDDLGKTLGICRPVQWAEGSTSPAIEALVGNRVLPGMRPYASRYGGHQFGNWAGQLGDGRAITLGEMVNEQGQRWELQLKGAGLTPYSRTADGLAVLRSSIREFLCSEAMHHLGVPTTRALSLVVTGEQVVRDMFYDGHPELEPGAVVCRVAPSFIRFGHFEILTASGELDLLKQLADLVIQQHFPEYSLLSQETYASWFQEVCRRTAVLIAEWMRVGFVHGVMNTDNMSILGLTIDYGPYGWLENYDPAWTPNTTDAQGRRYCFGRQPAIALWNLQRLAEVLSPLINDKEALKEGLRHYEATFNTRYWEMLASKIGVQSLHPESDQPMMLDLFQLMQRTELDMTIFFRQLSHFSIAPAGKEPIWEQMLEQLVRPASYRPWPLAQEENNQWVKWFQRYSSRVQAEQLDPLERRQGMLKVNPKYVCRNYLAQQAIDATQQGDAEAIEKLLQVLSHPYDEQPEYEEYAQKRPEWARHRAGCSMLSCSS